MSILALRRMIIDGENNFPAADLRYARSCTVVYMGIYGDDVPSFKREAAEFNLRHFYTQNENGCEDLIKCLWLVSSLNTLRIA